MAAAPGQPARVAVEVVFLEIDALYDLPGRRLVGTADEPTVAIDNDLRDLLFVDYHRMAQHVDELGREVDGACDDVAGMVAAVGLEGSEPFWRTFSRRRTLPIDKKYVYVFRADSPAGGDLQLEREIYFDRGQMHLVDLEATAGSDVRRAAPGRKLALRLDVVRTRDERTVRPTYFALLAPVQLPWQRLQDVMRDGSVAARSSRLGDAFWTDGFTGGDPTRAKTFHELYRGGVRPDRLGLVLYLVDPFKEALRRLEPLQKSLDRWSETQRARGSEDRYVLAKRLDVFAHAYGLEDAVTPELPKYLLDADRQLFELRLAAEEGGEDLLRWIGRAQRRERIGDVDVCYRDRHGNDHAPREGQPFPTAWCNPFSDAVRDGLGGGADARDVARNVTLAVHARLGETTAGIAWMNEVFDELVEGRFPVASAGAELLFERRHGTVGSVGGATGDAWAPLFRLWAPVWVRRYGRAATKHLQGWLQARHGVDATTMGAAHPRRDWRALKKGRKDPELAWIDAAATRLVRLGDAAAAHVTAAFQLFNLAYSVSALREEQDDWHGLGLMAAIADDHADAAKHHEKVERARATFRYAGTTRRIEIAPFVVVAASAMDHVLAGRDRLNGKTDSARVGHATRCLGAALALASSPKVAAAGAGGVGALVAALMLEAAGAYAVADVGHAGVLLKHCAWGNGGDGFDRAFDRSREGTFLGYAGDLAALARDLEAQTRMLDQVLHDFHPQLDLERDYGQKTLVLHTGTGGEDRRRPLDPAARWTIELSLDHGDGRPPEPWSFRAGGTVTHSDAGMNEPLHVKAFTKPRDLDPHARARVTVVGTARLDPTGTGAHVIERPIEGTFDLGWVGR